MNADDSLTRNLTWLYGDPKRCKCEHSMESLGIVDRINMGKGWVRTTTHPDCPEHGTAAERARRARQKSRGGV